MHVKLKDIAEIIAGQSPESKYYNNVGLGLPFLQGNRTFTEKYPIIDTFTTKITKVVQPNTILMSVRAPVGDLNIADREICIGRGLVGLNSKTFNNDYLYYILKYNINRIIKNGNGTTYNSITIETLKELEIEIPIGNEVLITNILLSIDRQIERNNAMVKRLQDLGNTIYSDYAKNIVEYKNIQDISEIVWGQCPNSENILSQNNIKSIEYASGAGDIEQKLKVIPKAYTDNPKRKIDKYDICLSVAGTVGKLAISYRTIAIGRAMLGIKNPKIYGYLYFALKPYCSILEKQATGAIQKIINNSHLDIINLPVYNDSIINKLNGLVNYILNIEEETIKLNILKNNLLPLLINGQLQ